MAFVAGSVTVNSNETESGSGLALALYLAEKPTLTLPALPTLGQTTQPYTAQRPATQSDIDLIQDGRIAILEDAARRATAWAGGLVPYVLANLKAVISTTTSAGILPSSLTAGTPIDPPSTDVQLDLE